MIDLTVRTKDPPMSFDAFCLTAPSLSIALDGYVDGGPNYNAEKRIANFDHHQAVDRLATRATCGQVLMALRQGLFRSFRTENGPEAHVFVNDCDEDVSLSWFLLKNHALCEQTVNPLLNRLVVMEDALDATAGAYPFPMDLPSLQELAWVFEPYRQFRLNGGLDKRDANAYRSIIDDVESRIGRHITGNGKTVPLDTRYERIAGGHGWTMATEIGPQARTGMFADGISAFISVREAGEGRWIYTIGRMSKFIPFDVRGIFFELNEAEKTHMADMWGGSDMVGGSPRISGSRIPPEKLTSIVNDFLKRND